MSTSGASTGRMNNVDSGGEGHGDGLRHKRTRAGTYEACSDLFDVLTYPKA